MSATLFICCELNCKVGEARQGETSFSYHPLLGLRKPARLVHLLCLNLRWVTKLLWCFVAWGRGGSPRYICKINGLTVCSQFLDFSKAPTNDDHWEVRESLHALGCPTSKTRFHSGTGDLRNLKCLDIICTSQ